MEDGCKTQHNKVRQRSWEDGLVRLAHMSAAAHLDPLLLVQVRDVKLLAGRVRQHLVVLLQDLVEALRHK